MIIKFNIILHSLSHFCSKLPIQLTIKCTKIIQQSISPIYPSNILRFWKQMAFSRIVEGEDDVCVDVEPIFHNDTMERVAVGQKLNALGTRFGQRRMNGSPLKLRCRLQLIIIMPPAQYCALCTFPFKQMGACPAPGKSLLYAYLSILPYLVPFLYIVLAALKRSIVHFKVFAMLASGYMIGDKLCKPIFKSPRPDFSCKSSFGMPSSHMIVMAIFALYRIRNTSSWTERAFWVVMTVLEGVSRMELNYHTLEQVIAGTIFGVAYALIFQIIWKKCIPYIPFLNRSEKPVEKQE